MNNRPLLNNNEPKIDTDKLCLSLSDSANKVVSFLTSKLQKDGSYGEDVKDIACYFKSPMMFIAANEPQKACAVLNYIKKTFMCTDGDFKTEQNLKSINSAYIEYWTYTNGWIIRAANQLSLNGIGSLGYQYLSQYDMGNNGFLTNEIHNIPQMTDILSVAHYGLINLESDHIETAITAGNYLSDAIQNQPNLKNGFYLRLDKEKNIICDFPKDKTPFYFVSTTEPNQLHFMIGYPAAYLAMLYKKTNNPSFLNAAQSYLDFSLSCDKSMYECNFSHKIAWAASLIYECTGEEKYLSVINKITTYFIENQKDGMWFSDNITSSYDQSAEIACWFLDIVKNINSFKKKVTLEEQNDIFRIHTNTQTNLYSNPI